MTKMEVCSSDTLFEQGSDMELALQEDIGAELDDFLLLSLLGIDGEAQECIRIVLWRHLRYFPIFAEVADYLIEKGDTSLKAQLLRTIMSENINFPHPHERVFLDTVVTILEDEHQAVQRFLLDFGIISSSFDNWNDPILCHLFEIRLNLAARNSIHDDSPSFFLQILDVSLRFLNRQMPAEAARCFAIAAASCPHTSAEISAAQDFKLHDIYRRILDSTGTMDKDEIDTEIDESRRIALRLKISYLRHLRELGFLELDSVVQEMQSLLGIAFSTLPNPRPRGQHFEFVRSLRAQRMQGAVESLPREMPQKHQLSLSGAATMLQNMDGQVHARFQEQTPELYVTPSPVPIISRPTRAAPEIDTSTTEHERISEAEVAEQPLATRTQHLSEIMTQFVAIEALEDCRDFCIANSMLFSEDAAPLHRNALVSLQRGHFQAAHRFVQRRMILRSATRALEGPIDWITSLPTNQEKQDQLAEQCLLVLEAFQEGFQVQNESVRSGLASLHQHPEGYTASETTPYSSVSKSEDKSTRSNTVWSRPRRPQEYKASRAKSHEYLIPKSPETSPEWMDGPPMVPGLSDIMKAFTAQKTFSDCRKLCESNPELFEEEHSQLQAHAVRYLQQGREDFAVRLIERRLMLRFVATTREGPEWMRRLPESKSRQDQLERSCAIVLEALREALEGSIPPVPPPTAALSQRSRLEEGRQSKTDSYESRSRSKDRQGSMTERPTKSRKNDDQRARYKPDAASSGFLTPWDERTQGFTDDMHDEKFKKLSAEAQKEAKERAKRYIQTAASPRSKGRASWADEDSD